MLITKTNGVTASTPGTSTTYTIVVSNAGPSTAANVVVADVFPASLSSVTWTCIAAGGARVPGWHGQHQRDRHHSGRRYGHVHRDGNDQRGGDRIAREHGDCHAGDRRLRPTLATATDTDTLTPMLTCR